MGPPEWPCAELPQGPFGTQPLLVFMTNAPELLKWRGGLARRAESGLSVRAGKRREACIFPLGLRGPLGFRCTQHVFVWVCTTPGAACFSRVLQMSSCIFNMVCVCTLSRSCHTAAWSRGSAGGIGFLRIELVASMSFVGKRRWGVAKSATLSFVLCCAQKLCRQLIFVHRHIPGKVRYASHPAPLLLRRRPLCPWE